MMLFMSNVVTHFDNVYIVLYETESYSSLVLLRMFSV